MANIKITRVGVSYKGKDIPLGEIVETDAASAASLIADGYAEAAAETVAENALKSPVSPSNPSGDKLPEGTGEGQTGGQQEDGGGKNEGTENPTGEDALAKTKKAINDKYKRDELYDAAKLAGVEIAFDAKKADIIDAVIAQGKAEALLK